MVKFLGAGILCYMVSSPLFAAQWQGVLDWSQRTELSTVVSGVISDVSVVPGERVKKGRLLLTLEQGALRARLEQHRSEMKHNKLLRDEASKELERAEELYARTLLADHDLNLAKVAYAAADAAYQASRADTRESEEALQQSQIKAPFDAIVLDRLALPGETVISRCQAQPLLILAAAGEMRILFTVDGDTIDGLDVGRPVMVDVSGKRYIGKIASLGYEPESIKASPRYSVVAVFPVDAKLRAGQSATVSLP